VKPPHPYNAPSLSIKRDALASEEKDLRKFIVGRVLPVQNKKPTTEVQNVCSEPITQEDTFQKIHAAGTGSVISTDLLGPCH
jgi:hypothetical protein